MRAKTGIVYLTLITSDPFTTSVQCIIFVLFIGLYNYYIAAVIKAVETAARKLYNRNPQK